MVNRFRGERLVRILNATVTVPSWILMAMNFMIGLVVGIAAWTSPELLDGMQNSFFGGRIWAPSLAIGSLFAMLGAWRKRLRFIKTGSFVAALAWVFGVTSYLSSGPVAINALVFGLPGFLFYVYLYLKFFSQEQLSGGS